MPQEILTIANSWGLWLVSFSVILIVLVQTVLYTRLAFQAADRIGFPKEKCIQGFRSGAVSAIGPSIAVFIVMVGMMSVLGGPITWLRLTIIGSAATELTAARLSADALGIVFGSADFDGIALANAYWAMSINGIGWILFVGIFASRMESIRLKIGGGDTKWLGMVGVAASIGAFSYLNISSIFPVVQKTMSGLPASFGVVGACLGGLLGMIAMLNLAKRLPWLKEYTLGIAMLIGLGVAILFN